jgi:hypothetical protein
MEDGMELSREEMKEQDDACLMAARRSAGGYHMYAEVQRQIADRVAKRGLVVVVDGPTPFGTVRAA